MNQGPRGRTAVPNQTRSAQRTAASGGLDGLAIGRGTTVKISMQARNDLRYRVIWRSIGWCLIAAVVYASLTPHPPDPGLPGGDKLGHGSAYFVLMLWFLQCYRPSGWWLVAVGLALLGTALEVAQAWTGSRTFELADVASNIGGILFAWLTGLTPAADMLAFVERRLAAPRQRS